MSYRIWWVFWLYPYWCMQTNGWYSPHSGHPQCTRVEFYSLITLENHHSETFFYFFLWMLMVSSTCGYQHFSFKVVLFFPTYRPPLAGLLLTLWVCLNIKVWATWFSFKSPYLLCAQPNEFDFLVMCTLVGCASSLLWSGMLSEWNCCLYAVPIKSHCLQNHAVFVFIVTLGHLLERGKVPLNR